MKVAILGTAPYHKFLAPFDDEEWEIWVCSPGNMNQFKRVTRWFELHGVDDCKGPENNGWNKPYFDWLQTQTFPVYMQEPNELVPQAKVFPIQAWLRTHGRLGRIAASSSIALMIGFALMEGAEQIGVFGVDMAADEEQYGNQKTGCLIMLELAVQKLGAANVNVPLSSCLVSMPPLYGYAEATRAGRKLLVRETLLKEELKNVSGQLEAALRCKEWLSGNLEAISYCRRTFVDGAEDAELDASMELLNGMKPVEEVFAATTSQDRDRPSVVAETSPERVPVDERPSGLLVPRRGNSHEHHAG